MVDITILLKESCQNNVSCQKPKLFLEQASDQCYLVVNTHAETHGVDCSDIRFPVGEQLGGTNAPRKAGQRLKPSNSLLFVAPSVPRLSNLSDNLYKDPAITFV